jgi:hypothetical protein
MHLHVLSLLYCFYLSDLAIQEFAASWDGLAGIVGLVSW